MVRVDGERDMEDQKQRRKLVEDLASRGGSAEVLRSMSLEQLSEVCRLVEAARKEAQAEHEQRKEQAQRQDGLELMSERTRRQRIMRADQIYVTAVGKKLRMTRDELREACLGMPTDYFERFSEQMAGRGRK
jgi:hypothetical protein